MGPEEDDEEEKTEVAAEASPSPSEEERNAAAPKVSRGDTRYPLAYDSNGNPIRLPPNAVAWRVRRGGGKRGRPKNVFDQGSGRQLEIALGASLDDLIATNVIPDRYLLYPVDAEGNIIPGIVAMTELQDGDGDSDDEEPATEGLTAENPNPMVALLAKQHQLMESIVAEQKFMMAENAKALAAAVSGYAPVRPPAPIAPTPIIMEQPPQAPQSPGGAAGIIDSIANLKPEQMFQFGIVIKQLYDMIRGPGPGSAGGVFGGAVGGGS